MKQKNFIQYTLAASIMITSLQSFAITSSSEIDRLTNEQLQMRLKDDKKFLADEVQYVDQLSQVINYTSNKRSANDKEKSIYKVSSIISWIVTSYALESLNRRISDKPRFGYELTEGYEVQQNLKILGREVELDLQKEIVVMKQNLAKTIEQHPNDEKALITSIELEKAHIRNWIGKRFNHYPDISTLMSYVEGNLAKYYEKNQKNLTETKFINEVKNFDYIRFNLLDGVFNKSEKLAKETTWRIRIPLLVLSAMTLAYTTYKGFIKDKSNLEKSIDQVTANMDENQIEEYLNAKENESLLHTFRIEKIEDEINYINAKLGIQN